MSFRPALFALAVVAHCTNISVATEPPQMTIEYRNSAIVIEGDVSSVAHEAILRQTVLRLFPESDQQIELRELPGLMPGWALVTEMTLRAIAETHSAIAKIDDTGITVRGIATDAGAWQAAASRIRDGLPQGVEFRDEISTLQPAGSFDRQCLALFRTSLTGRRIEFQRGDENLSTSNFPLLDELIQIAVDCPRARITVTGHTDNTGSEAGNRALSEARARSVVAYMISGGLSELRLTAIGAGSTEPLVDENSTRARQLNRRIEFRFEFP